MEGMRMNKSLATLIDETGVDVLDYLDREALVPVLTGLQCQGDVAVIPHRPGRSAYKAVPVPAAGVPVVRGESGGNTHLLLAEGPVNWTATPNVTDLSIGVVDVPDGSVAYLAHPEHGYLAMAPGAYILRRQREQADELRMVAD
jgi:hypothetical protein